MVLTFSAFVCIITAFKSERKELNMSNCLINNLKTISCLDVTKTENGQVVVYDGHLYEAVCYDPNTPEFKEFANGLLAADGKLNTCTCNEKCLPCCKDNSGN